MDITLTLNGKTVTDTVADDMLLLDFLRKHKCLSVRRSCETTSCGSCTVLMDGKPVLSCSTPLGRANGHSIETLEGLREEAKGFVDYFANQGADQCGFCNPGYVVNIVALLRLNPDPSEAEIQHWLMGNLCRCTGYQSHARALHAYLNARKEAGHEAL